MSFLKTISEEESEGLIRDQYQTAQKSMGYVPNYIKAFNLRPEVYEIWSKLIREIRSKMRLRRYELVTFASALALKCRYCLLAHGAVLRKNFFRADQLAAIARDFHNAGLPPEEVAIMSFAQKVTTQSQQVCEKDIDQLRGYGLSDEEILDVILASAARNFFSKTLNATGAIPDEAYSALEPELFRALSAGRPVP